MNFSERICWFGCVVGVVLFQAGSRPAPADVVRARAFELVDGQGRVVGELRTGPEGGAALVLRDEKQEVALLASTAAPGGSLRLYAPEQKEPLVEATAGTLGGALQARNRSGRPSVLLGPSARDLGGEVTVFDTAGQNSATMARHDSGSGAFVAWKIGGQASAWSSPQ